ncbi:hypothetical protein [Streptomyces parvulus]|uniref:Uncharacterized protein n=1 Tax=Streptomyces parvulus TaxID=146923 RepID=A0A369UZ07_9ACTN|nr:hypothetical protein [Streptomyces parvulus]RDD85731.1 hypothetical protein DVZ84_28730 [Streptomyces parvulus]
MTRDRRRKMDIRATARGRYTPARRRTLPPAGLSIAEHPGELYLCGTCGQPAYPSAIGPCHFTEQDGGVYCPTFPMAANLLRMDWRLSLGLDIIREFYPWPTTGPAHRTPTMRQEFGHFTGKVYVCASCGQPAHNTSDYWGPQHFHDQWDGVHCEWFPLAGRLLITRLHPRSLADWKAGYTT